MLEIRKPWYLRSSKERHRRTPPKYLLTKSGKLRRPHRGFEDLVKCRECGANLRQSESGFICSQCTGSPLIVAHALYDRCRKQWEELEPPKRPRVGLDAVFHRIVLLIEWRERRPDLI
jgi:hypothetical protein